MKDVVTIPNTAVKINERRKKRIKNGMSRITNRVRERNSDGRRKNQPKMKSTNKFEKLEFAPLKTSSILILTNRLTSNVSQ